MLEMQLQLQQWFGLSRSGLQSQQLLILHLGLGRKRRLIGLTCYRQLGRLSREGWSSLIHRFLI
jgi:hypothetical protein